VAGIALIAMPVAFNVSFALLGSRFDYPDILRRPTSRGFSLSGRASASYNGRTLATP